LTHKNTLALMLKTEFKIPIMKAKVIAMNEETYEKAVEFLAYTYEGWCWNILDYRDSEELKELRKKYGNYQKSNIFKK